MRTAVLRPDRVAARRSGRRGLRTYGHRHLALLQQILLLSGAGFALAEIGASLDRETGRSPAAVFAAQAELLEVAELSLRCQRVVITAVAETLQRHPGADVPAEVITAVIDVDTTCCAVPRSTGASTSPIWTRWGSSR